MRALRKERKERSRPRERASVRPDTLRQHYDLAAAFLSAFSGRSTIDVADLDELGVSMGRLVAINGPVSTDDPAWSHRVKQRQELISDVNLGGQCDLFELAQRFQLCVVKNGRTYQIKPLMEAIDSVGKSLSLTGSQRLESEVRKVERMISACDPLSLPDAVRGHIASLFDTIDDHTAMNDTMNKRFLIKVQRVELAIKSPTQENFLKLLSHEPDDDPTDPTGGG